MVTAYDVTGRRMVRLVPDAGRQKAMINTSGWASGVYLITVQRASGDISTAKVVIDK